MKKIMIIALIAAVSVFSANAATVSWKSGSLKLPATAEGGWSATSAGSKVTGYLFMLTEAEYTAYTANTSSIYTDWKAGTLTADVTAKSSMSAVTLSDKVDYATGTELYAAVLYTYTDATLGGDFYIANTGTFTMPDSSATQTVPTQFGTSVGSWTAAVPEPTSGLLMLVGLAGLALRRRRA